MTADNVVNHALELLDQAAPKSKLTLFCAVGDEMSVRHTFNGSFEDKVTMMMSLLQDPEFAEVVRTSLEVLSNKD